MYEPAPPAELQQGVIAREVYFWSVDRFSLGIALTPACDFEQGKVELVTFCSVLDAVPVLSKLLAKDLADDSGNRSNRVSKNKLGRVKSAIEQVIKRRWLRFHWLAPLLDSQTPQLVDFTIVTSLPMSEAADLECIAQLRSPYKEEVSARYSAYLGRVGIPDFTEEELSEWTSHVIRQLLPEQENAEN